MLEEVIFKNYGVRIERQESNGYLQMFRSGNVLISLVPLEEVNKEELEERQKMSEYLLRQGDRYVSTFVMSNNRSYISENEGKLFILLANEALEEPRAQMLGRKLAKFHQRARTFPHQVKACTRIGKWKELWEQRVDQLEAVWREKVQSHPNNLFERMFVDTFPYYMAMGENAIQYLADTEIDAYPDLSDAGTVCHERFSKETWGGKYCIKNPFDWVFDHCSRDIAEWVRQHYLDNPYTFYPGLLEFISDYQNHTRLSSFSARLLFSRLIFPIHYYEAAENYFMNPPESMRNQLEESLSLMVDQSHLYEAFLQNFYEAAEIPVNTLRIPKLDWL